MDNFDPYNVFLAIATNIPQRLKTGFVLQGHMCELFILISKQKLNPRRCCSLLAFVIKCTVHKLCSLLNGNSHSVPRGHYIVTLPVSEAQV